MNEKLPPRAGETLGHGHPDWPEDLTTFAERKAYQRGVADARAVLSAQQAELPSGYPLTQEQKDFAAKHFQAGWYGCLMATQLQPSEQDNYKAWYEEAMAASNEAGCVGMDAAQTIRALAADLAAALARPVATRLSGPPWLDLETAINEFIEEYEFRGGDGDYRPTANERLLIADAVMGILSDDDIVPLLSRVFTSTTTPNLIA